MTSFPWKLFKDNVEIVFPKGSRRFVQFDVQQIQTDGAVEFDWNARAVWTGDAAFRLHAISISCTDQTPAPISDLWQGHIVRLEAPFEFSVPGPAATLKYDPVAGSVYGVDANDRVVGTTYSGSRSVSIPGAVAIRFRPTMDCRVVSRTGPGGSQGRADASWSIELIEQAGDVVEESGSDTLTFAAPGLQAYELGDTITLNLASFVTTTTGLPLFFAIASGSLPAGMAMVGNGLISGMPSASGLHVITVMAASGPVSAVQTIPFYAPLPTISSKGVALQNYTVGSAYESLYLETLVEIANTNDFPSFSLVSGSLPPGLYMIDGVIDGTPTGYGAFAATFSLTLPTGQSTEVSVAFFAQDPDAIPDAVILGGEARTWTDTDGGVSVDYGAQDFMVSGTLTVIEAGWLEYILAGGGGAGATVSSTGGSGGGGGGAGGFVRGRVFLPVGTYPVNVGSGGVSGSPGSSTFFGMPGSFFSRTAVGGGPGGTAGTAGGSGGCGGGGGGGASGAQGAGGVAVNEAYGSNGAVGVTSATVANRAGGGGGGFSGPGFSGSTASLANGGPGLRVVLWGILQFCGGGGAGAASGNTISWGRATNGGGSGSFSTNPGGAATPNTGGGGGGAPGGTSGTRLGGAGGSGRAIFIIKRRVS